MTHAAPSFDYSSNYPYEHDDLADEPRIPRYATKRSRHPKRSQPKRAKKAPRPDCGFAARRNHRIEW